MDDKLTYKKIFFFWLPLLSTWMMMAVEGPYLAAVIGRLPYVKVNLAAYGIAYSVGLIIESPIIMLMSASTALVKSRYSYIKLRNFSYVLIIILTLGMLFFLIRPVFHFIFKELLTLNDNVLVILYPALAGLIPWAGAIGYRRFYQGVIIRHGKPKYVAFGTIIRVTTIIFAAIVLSHTTKMHSAVIATTTLSMAVVFEAVATRFFAHKSVKNVLGIDVKETVSYRNIAYFYFPMATTPLIALAVPPMTTFFLLKGKFPTESVAVVPVLNSLTFIFRAVGLSFQEIAIALMDATYKNFKKIRNFMLMLFAFNLICYGLISFTPMSDFYFKVVSGFPDDLANIAKIPARIMTFIPPLTALLAFQRSIIVKSGNTMPMTIATVIEVCITFSILLTIPMFDIAGVIVSSSALLIGRIISNLYLHYVTMKIVREGR